MHFEFGPLDIRPGQNIIETNKSRIPQPKIDGWIVGFTPTCGSPTAGPPSTKSTCITASGRPARLDATALLPERFFGVGEEKTALHMPPGYGYRYTPNDYWWLNYMIHDLTDVAVQSVDHLRRRHRADDDAPPGGMKDVHPIWMDVLRPPGGASLVGTMSTS